MTVSRIKCFEDMVCEEEDFVRIVNWFADKRDRALVALSGGVDSAVVALAAKKSLGNNALAATADYDTLSKEELSSARKIAQEIGICHVVIKYNQLEMINCDAIIVVANLHLTWSLKPRVEIFN